MVFRQTARTLVVALGICLIIGASVSSAWEFSMAGDWNWEYKLYSQMGDNGFFGKFNISNATTLGDGASYNGWLGNEITGDFIVSGADASASTMYTFLRPEIRITQAVRLRGSYYIGSWIPIGLSYSNLPFPTTSAGAGSFMKQEYFTNTIPGTQSSFSPGYWNTFWVTAQTPWGIVVLGKRPFSFGTGLILDGADNTTYEGLLIVAPYGPFRIGGAWMPWTQGSSDYFTQSDKNAVQTLRVGGFFTYDSGPLSFGAITELIRWHGGPESQFHPGNSADGPGTPGRYGYVPNDNELQYVTAFTKFNNGRFFFNAEAAFIRLDTHNQRNLSGVDNLYIGLPGGDFSAFAPYYTEHARYMTELGCFCGPAKLSLFWGYVQGGEDRRNGIKIDRQADTRGLSQFSNYSVFRPYSILFAWDYGSGNGSYTSRPTYIGSDNGYVTDANTYAARLDYAVAANLNVYGSFFWAERISKGNGWGYIAPLSVVNFSVYPLVTYTNKSSPDGVAPAIPDNALGYEIDWGFDWKLLEGYTLCTAFGYWVPGKWFNYACIDRRVVGWDEPSLANNFGINPNRKIDPVFGMDVVLKAEF